MIKILMIKDIQYFLLASQLLTNKSNSQIIILSIGQIKIYMQNNLCNNANLFYKISCSQTLSNKSCQSDREKVLSRANMIQNRQFNRMGSLKKCGSKVSLENCQTPSKKFAKRQLPRVKSTNTIQYSNTRAETLNQLAQKLKEKHPQPSTANKGFNKLGGIMRGIKKFNKEGQTIQVIKKIGGNEEIAKGSHLTRDQKFTILLKEFKQLKNQFREIRSQNEEMLKGIKTEQDEQKVSTSTYRKNFFQSYSPDSPINTPKKRKPSFDHENSFSCSSSNSRQVAQWKIPCFSCGCTCHCKKSL